METSIYTHLVVAIVEFVRATTRIYSKHIISIYRDDGNKPTCSWGPSHCKNSDGFIGDDLRKHLGVDEPYKTMMRCPKSLGYTQIVQLMENHDL